MDGVTFNYHYMKQVHIRPGGGDKFVDTNEFISKYIHRYPKPTNICVDVSSIDIWWWGSGETQRYEIDLEDEHDGFRLAQALS
jgi:hypothetical protein